jgi:DNA-binding MarR family transcriptional regulator
VDHEERLRRSLEAAPVLRLIALAGHVTSQQWSRLMNQQHGMTSAGVNTLLMLAWGTGRGGVEEGTPGRATNAELARRLWIRPATMSGIVDTLIKADYVARTRDVEDRRVVWLTLTEAGKARVGEIGDQLRDAFNPEHVTPDPEHEKIIREFLIDLIMTYRDKESFDEWAGRPGRRRGSRSDQAVPET